MVRNVNGLQIHYEIKQNDKSGETPVLLLHGWGCDLGIFTGLMDALQGRATLIGLDFPAHGQSGEPLESWAVRDFAEQVKQLLQVHQISKIHIVAHSFGARVAIWLAAHDPQMVDKLVITGGAGVKKPVTKEADKRTARYKRLSAITRFFMRIPLLKRPMQRVQNLLIQKYGSKDYAKLSEKMRATFVKVISEDLTPLLKQIAAPTLLIWGSADTETPLWMGETMEREIGDAGLIVFDGGSHYAFLEESARFLMIVNHFFWGGHEG
ncbi:MAG: alpha/beta hydrolase [Bacillota bacterium]